MPSTIDADRQRREALVGRHHRRRGCCRSRRSRCCWRRRAPAPVASTSALRLARRSPAAASNGVSAIADINLLPAGILAEQVRRSSAAGQDGATAQAAGAELRRRCSEMAVAGARKGERLALPGRESAAARRRRRSGRFRSPATPAACAAAHETPRHAPAPPRRGFRSRRRRSGSARSAPRRPASACAAAGRQRHARDVDVGRDARGAAELGEIAGEPVGHVHRGRGMRAHRFGERGARLRQRDSGRRR